MTEGFATPRGALVHKEVAEDSCEEDLPNLGVQTTFFSFLSLLRVSQWVFGEDPDVVPIDFWVFKIVNTLWLAFFVPIC